MMLLHAQFEKQARRMAERPAVVCEGRSLSYRELNGRANSLARYLRTLSVMRDERVGLCFERDLPMLVGILGILKAGAAYVPIEPDSPLPRLVHMLADSAPRVVLSQESIRRRAPATEVPWVALDSQWSELASHEDSDLTSAQTGVTSRNLAYVIYTSGSTGTPKGVMVEHANVANLWRALECVLPPSAARERVGVNASYTFDSSVKQLIQILSGRTLVLIPQVLRLHPRMFLQYLDEQRVDTIDCTPSQLRGWIAAGFPEKRGRALRTVLVGGEPIDAALWDRLAHHTDIAFFNVYGPTECTVDTTVTRIHATTPHIGKPLQNVRVYVLDADRRPVTHGTPGEIYIAGAGVARGYLNQPQLTQERYLPDPFHAGARMYRSGDLGRWRADGNLEYLGRNDDQVKVRGHRIELGEIEAHLCRHCEVREAAVVVVRDGTADSRLVACVCLKDAYNSATPETLRASLRSTLPEYMVPAAFIVLDHLPLTSNGKLNRPALCRSVEESCRR